MKHLLILSLMLCSVLMGSAQRVIKEKTETKVDGPYITKKTKVEYKKAPQTTLVGESNTSHKAYRSLDRSHSYRMTHHRSHYRYGSARTGKYKMHHHPMMHYREYKKVIKNGKTKIKYKR